MTESNSTDFRHHAQDIHFELLPECSVSRHLSSTGTFYELTFLEAIGRTMPSETVAFDVGAHIGNHTIYFAKVLGWTVFAFEPNPDAFEKLVANVERNGLADKVTCFQVALADVPGAVRMARTEPSDAGTVAVVTGDAPPGSHVEVEAATLDSYLHLAEAGPTLLKIDVEGYEAEVLRGLSHPIPALSFEYLPAATDVARRAAALLAALGPYRFNPTIGERRRFVWEQWRPVGALDAWLAARRADEPSGDVYARLED